MLISDLAPATEDALAVELLTLQRAAYAVEAELIGDDRIPGLHEDLRQLRDADLSWLGSWIDGRLVGALAWTADPVTVDVDRLVVAPAMHRSGLGRALVREVLRRADGRVTVVSTGRDNLPARALYESVGFTATEDIQVLPDLWVTRFTHRP
ncbi:GNAT family N-acetyltransferase [Modestobacter sp. SYSU DS0511]